MDRKHFLLNTTAAATAFMIQPLQGLSQKTGNEPYSTAIVKEFVAAGHGNLEKVKQMLAEHPNLLYARHDWGGGDFEEAIEGAGHVGNREIATWLIENGARPNIFVLAMLGETGIVSSMIRKYPALLNAKGPHGLSLLHHATKGGDPAKELLEFLKEKGLREMKFPIK
ncbi:MAG TPA: hypothetical protein VFZ78_09525 [Flavisolibacter sp.]